MLVTPVSKHAPGAVRDAILKALAARPEGETVEVIGAEVTRQLGPIAASSIRSYLRLNTSALFTTLDRGRYALSVSARVEEEAQATLPFSSPANGHRGVGANRQ